MGVDGSQTGEGAISLKTALAEAIAQCVVSEDPWFEAFDARIREVGYSTHAFGHSFDTRRYEHLILAQSALARRLTGAEPYLTKRLIDAAAPDTKLIAQWLMWHAILTQEIDLRLKIIHVDGQATVAEQNRGRILGAFLGRQLQRGTSISDLDYYLEKLSAATCALADKIIQTTLGAADYSPNSIDHAVGMLVKFAELPMRGVFGDSTSDTFVQSGKLSTEIDADEKHVPLGYYADEELENKMSNLGRLYAEPSTEEAASEDGVDGVIVVIYTWAQDDRSLRDRSVRGGTKHVLFGFTALEKVALKTGLPLLVADESLRPLPDNVRRALNSSQDEIRRLLYMLGALGPYDSFENVESLERTVARTDTIYSGQSRGNRVLKLLTAASLATLIGHSGDYGRVTQASLRRFLQATKGCSYYRAKQDFEKAKAGHPPIQDQDAIDALHYCEDSFAVSLDRLDPHCVLATNCPGHPVSSAFVETKKAES